MATDRIKRLINIIRWEQEAAILREQIATLQELEGELNPLAEKIGSFETKVKIRKKLGKDTFEPLINIIKNLQSIIKLISPLTNKKYQANKKFVEEDKISHINYFLEGQEKGLKESWDQWWQTHFFQVFRMGTAIKGINDLSNLRSDIDGLSREYEKYKIYVPESQDDATHIEGLRTQRDGLSSSLEKAGVKGDIQKFLIQATSPEGAPLEVITPEVQEWLEKNKASENFRIWSPEDRDS